MTMSEDTTYNGWANYATWRVNLELFNGQTISDIFGYDERDAYCLGKMLKDRAEEYVEDTSDEGIARDYAMAFLSDVNWYEIAEQMIADAIEAEEYQNKAA